MIDVIFLLLIFFVLTARFRRPEQFLPFTLAQTDSSAEAQGLVEPLVIHLSGLADGRCRVTIGAAVAGTEAAGTGSTAGMRTGPAGAGAEVVLAAEPTAEQLERLAQRVGEVMQRQKRTVADPVSLECDDNVAWDHLVKVYNLLFAMGIHNIAFPMAL